MSGATILRALVAKRREILAELDHHRRAAGRLARDLEHVDAMIRVFTSEPARALLGALWIAGEPLSADQLAAKVGIAPKLVGRTLRYLGACGLVRGEHAHGQATTWHPTY